MDTSTGADLLSLRPRGGGVEWTARRAEVRPARTADRPRSALVEVNARSHRRYDRVLFDTVQWDPPEGVDPRTLPGVTT
ncbi:hypothetical protein ACSMX9_24785 [Streptomyces sp. LE64]|uniref:hypothetical protein n=1 Tax=Streptomyces sp. LE64 TaxID=3448653 RepID=UPI0040414DE4